MVIGRLYTELVNRVVNYIGAHAQSKEDGKILRIGAYQWRIYINKFRTETPPPQTETPGQRLLWKETAPRQKPPWTETFLVGGRVRCVSLRCRWLS